MNEPKKRGRPSNTEIAARMQAETQAVVAHTVAQVARETPSPAQAYADRVWAGQSIDAPREWRVERVRLALLGQGLSMEGVVLP